MPETVLRVGLGAVILMGIMLAAWIVLVERIGRVVLTLDDRHGVHAGDVFALAPLALAAGASALLFQHGQRT